MKKGLNGLVLLAALLFVAIVIAACITPESDNVTTGEKEAVECPECPEGFRAPTPPRGPGYITIPPQGTVHWFVHYYNERNASMLYSLFSDRVKSNHTVKEIENTLLTEFKIVKWEEVGEERISHPYVFLNVSFTLKNLKNGNVSNVTVELPMVYKCGEFLIDEWIFKFLVNSSALER